MRKKIKIGITCYPSYGGSGVLATELGKLLARRGHEVHFITSSLPFRLSLRLEKNIFFHEVNTDSYSLFEHFPYTLALASKQKEVIESEGLDILHVHYAIPHAISAYLVNLMLKEKEIPFITTLHGTDITIVGKQNNFFDMTCLAIKKSQAVTAVSDYLKRETEKLFSTQREIQTIHNFIDFNIFVPKEKVDQRDKFLSEKDGILFIHISNFREVKRTPDVIEVFNNVQKQVSANLIMVGNGSEMLLCQQMAKEMGIQDRVYFLGKQEEVVTLLNLADILIFPSSIESFGLAALEAMACEIPVVACDSGGIPEVVKDRETGFLCSVGDIESLSQSCLKLARDPNLRKAMGKAGRERAVKLFHHDLIVDQYEELYYKALECWSKSIE